MVENADAAKDKKNEQLEAKLSAAWRGPVWWVMALSVISLIGGVTLFVCKADTALNGISLLVPLGKLAGILTSAGGIGIGVCIVLFSCGDAIATVANIIIWTVGISIAAMLAGFAVYGSVVLYRKAKAHFQTVKTTESFKADVAKLPGGLAAINATFGPNGTANEIQDTTTQRYNALLRGKSPSPIQTADVSAIAASVSDAPLTTVPA